MTELRTDVRACNACGATVARWRACGAGGGCKMEKAYCAACGGDTRAVGEMVAHLALDHGLYVKAGEGKR